MKKIFSLCVAALAALTMTAQDIAVNIKIVAQSGGESTLLLASGNGVSSADNATLVAPLANTDNVAIYVQGDERYSIYATDGSFVNLPIAFITDRMGAAAQSYTLYFEDVLGGTGTGSLTIKDLVTGDVQTIVDGESYGPFVVNTTNAKDYVAGTNTVIGNRFVINYVAPSYVIMKGDFENPDGEWAYTSNFTGNGTSYTLDLDLAADTWYHFQLEEGSNTNIAANGSAFDRDHASHNIPVDGWHAQLTLYADVAGTYTFTWDHLFDNLTITFPAPPCVTVRSGLEVGRYYTICLPKNVVASDGASFWTMSNRGADVAYLVEETGELAAGKPYIFQAEAATLCVTYGTEEDAAGTNGALVGTFVEMNQAALNAAVAANDGSDIYLLNNNALWKVNGQSDNHLAPNRAYIVYNLLDYSVPNQVPGRRVRAIPMQNQGTTGVENLNATEAPVKTVIDGKLYIIRGEHMFDATGRMVK